MKVKPMLFNAEMVRAVHSGRKKQTRRPVPAWQLAREEPLHSHDTHPWVAIAQRDPRYGFGVSGATEAECMQNLLEAGTCPHGRVGDLIWVREAWRLSDDGTPSYRATDDKQEGKWNPSIHMKRLHSRLTLEITEVKLERLQDISEKDAAAEGSHMVADDAGVATAWSHRKGFISVWNSAYGPESWNANPWVWVISFKTHHKNIDTFLAEKVVSLMPAGGM